MNFLTAFLISRSPTNIALLVFFFNIVNFLCKNANSDQRSVGYLNILELKSCWVFVIVDMDITSSLILQEALKSYELVFDAIYTPKITRLLREADECGVKIVTGVEMFIGQAYEQYERFTGLPGKSK